LEGRHGFVKPKKLIEYCQIRAPTSGVVKKVFVREQSFINGTLSPHLLPILSED
jgi:multidrug resistance efflux pump